MLRLFFGEFSTIFFLQRKDLFPGSPSALQTCGTEQPAFRAPFGKFVSRYTAD